MKISKYSFLFHNDSKEYYAYNTLSNSLLEINEESYDQLLDVQNGKKIIDIATYGKEFYDALLKNNIITENDDDDFLIYKSIIAKNRIQDSSMHLTLAPTMDCCFHCHYCFEKFKGPKRMSAEIMNSIISYITSKPNLKEIKITWFGGEPLMAQPQIEEFYDRFSSSWEKTIASNIITTGYHINLNAIRTLKKIGVAQVQITLDGLKETHNRIKYLSSGDDVFERVISNIELLNNIAPEINVVIRVNLTLENAHEYVPLYEYLVKRFNNRQNIGIAPAFVLDRGISNCSTCESHDTLFDHLNRSEYILNLAKRGFDSPFIHYPKPFFSECAIRNDMAIAFDPEGYAYKCWEVIGNKEYAIGKLNDDGQLIDINEKVLNRQLYGADPLEDPTCSQCKYLPICNGGCPIQRIENKFEGGRNSVCSYYKGYMVEFLKIHLARKKAGFENY